MPPGGRKVSVARPRVRSTQGQEAVLPTWRALAETDLLSELAVNSSMPVLLAGLKRHVTSDEQEVNADRMAA